MTEYLKILYWTQITDDNVSFRPVFFFHPRVDILAFLEDRRYRDIPIQIRNTNGLYDGFHYATMDIATGLGACPADLDPVKPVYAATLASLSFTLYPTAPFVGEFAVLMDAPREKKDKDVLGLFSRRHRRRLHRPSSKRARRQRRPVSRNQEQSTGSLSWFFSSC